MRRQSNDWKLSKFSNDHPPSHLVIDKLLCMNLLRISGIFKHNDASRVLAALQ